LSDSPSPSDSLPAGGSPAPAADSPPLGTTFSLEGRPAPGLYLAAWLLSGIGLAVLFVGAQIGPPARGLLVMAGLLTLALGLGIGAGYQVLARRSRPAAAYRGPSPLLVFLVYFVVVNVLALALLALGLDLLTPVGITVGLGLQVIGYFIAVGLFAVRSGALSWRDLDLGRPAKPSRWLADALIGAGVMVPATLAVLLVTALIFALLGVQPPPVVPTPGNALDIVLLGVIVVLLVPIGEELFFRGFALTAWLRDLGERAALVRSSVFFAFYHIINVGAPTFDEGARQAVGVVLVILPVGIILGLLHTRRGLLAAIAAHATYNGLGYVLGLLAESLLPPSS
jgi:membrane protease YdiL (CAAX protease family)